MFQSSKIGLMHVPLIAILAAGCGGSAVSSQKVASAQSAVRGAVEAGADNDPDAALHLKIARDEITRARAESDEGNGETAARLLDRAELDAELAIALTRRTEAIERARKSQERAQSLQSGPSSGVSETPTTE